MTLGRRIALAVAVLAAPAAAVGAPSGALIAAVCANCHAPGAAAEGDIPSFAGLTGAEVAAALERFRAETAGASTIMPRIARGLTPADVAALAAHLDATGGAAP